MPQIDENREQRCLAAEDVRGQVNAELASFKQHTGTSMQEKMEEICHARKELMDLQVCGLPSRSGQWGSIVWILNHTVFFF